MKNVEVLIVYVTKWKMKSSKKYTWKQISKAIKIAFSRASKDSWNVPHHYESSARAEIRQALKRKEFN